jgi:thiol-disulfide isomerase/thioredoxin
MRNWRNWMFMGVLASGAWTAGARADAPALGRGYRAVLHSPGGPLPFRLDLFRDAPDGPITQAVIHNGAERIEVKDVTSTGDRLALHFPHYGSSIAARTDDAGESWNGSWVKPGRGGQVTRLRFSANPFDGTRFEPLPPHADRKPAFAPVAGKWRVRFSQSDAPALGVFEQAGQSVRGTFLTTTGDYRYLAGEFSQGRLRLSSFDGAHAFLFDARMQPDGTLRGDFWSRDTWHETWTADRAADDATLADGFSLVRARGPADLAALRFPDLDGKPHSLAEVCGEAKVCVLEVFGSWCPNCHDASQFLSQVMKDYGPRGVRVVGLAFEYTGERVQDAPRVRKFAERVNADYPILYGGSADRDEIARKLPFMDRLGAYPTTIILSRDGTVHAIHTGFSGPATGEAYEQLRRRFRAILDRALAGGA